jgi:group II intron reverse transcriptase/maturase
VTRWAQGREVREMRDADTILTIIRERGGRGLPLEGVYRQLYNPALYLRAYGRIYRNDGAMTHGVTAETVDGMSLAKIQGIIESLKTERHRWTPVRRMYIEKKGSTKLRPLGIPTWSDKLLQEVVRSLLEAYYEPQFSPSSHGFRPGLGCHTALTTIQRRWSATTWFIEGDISKCFDSLGHPTLLAILSEKIHDNRFLRLIENLLKAGYLEDWKYGHTFSGTPQGGVASPILSNIYLDRLDQYVEQVLFPEYNRGATRKPNKAYRRLRQGVEKNRHSHPEEAARLRKQMQRTPSVVLDDPDFRRLRYVRYADDFLLGFIGPREEAEAIKRRIGEFLHDQLGLELSGTKTLITHARTEHARFLGYDIGTLQQDERRGRHGRFNGKVALKVPAEAVRERCKSYSRRGRPIHRQELVHDSEFSIVAQFQGRYRGFAEYYKLATNRSYLLGRLKWVMETALTKTLALKLGISVSQVYARFGTTLQTAQGPRKGLEVRVERDGKPPLVARWGGITLARQRFAVLDDREQPAGVGHSELLARLLADACELCGSRDRVQVHHVRHLKDLLRRRRGQGPPPRWVQVMASRRRKTLVVCHECHTGIHRGDLRGHGPRTRVTGEPDAVKAARPVRRGADGKGPI